MAYCQNCKQELAPGASFCTNCGTPVAANMQSAGTAGYYASAPTNNNAQNAQNAQPAYNAQPSNTASGIVGPDAEFKMAAKKYCYCYFFWILFFIPICGEHKSRQGAKDVASNVFWLFIVNLGLVILGLLLSDVLIIGTLLSLLQTAWAIYAFVLFILAACGKAKRVVGLGNVAVFK